MDAVHKLISKQVGSTAKPAREVDYEMLSNVSTVHDNKNDTIINGVTGKVMVPSDQMVEGNSVISSDGHGDAKLKIEGNDIESNVLGAGVRKSNIGSLGTNVSDGGTVNYERVQTLCLITIAGVLTVAALQHLRAVMVPLVLAFLVTYPLTAVVDFLYSRAGCPKMIAITVSLMTAFGVIFFVGFIIHASVKELLSNIEEYRGTLHDAMDGIMDLLKKGGVASEEKVMERFDELPLGTFIANTLNSIIFEILSILETTFFVFVFAIYIQLGRKPGSGLRKGVVGRIEQRIQHFLAIKSMLSVAMGLSTTIILKSLNIHMATLFGLMAFVLNFIPNVGAVVSTLLPLPILLVSKEISLLKVILAVFLPTTVHLIIGSAVEPQILGDSLELHPITVMLCLIFWGLVWGIPGMLLAAPLTAALKIIFEGIEVLQPCAKLLEGKIDDLFSAWDRGEKPPRVVRNTFRDSGKVDKRVDKHEKSSRAE